MLKVLQEGETKKEVFIVSKADGYAVPHALGRGCKNKKSKKSDGQRAKNTSAQKNTVLGEASAYADVPIMKHCEFRQQPGQPCDHLLTTT